MAVFGCTPGAVCSSSCEAKRPPLAPPGLNGEPALLEGWENMLLADADDVDDVEELHNPFAVNRYGFGLARLFSLCCCNGMSHAGRGGPTGYRIFFGPRIVVTSCDGWVGGGCFVCTSPPGRASRCDWKEERRYCFICRSWKSILPSCLPCSRLARSSSIAITLCLVCVIHTAVVLDKKVYFNATWDVLSLPTNEKRGKN